MAKPQVWLIGPTDDLCFSPALAWLEGNARVHRVASVGEACNKIAATAASSSPSHETQIAAFLLIASRPGQQSVAAVEALHRLEPLARIAVLLGSWCEGEVRSGRVLPGVRRIYWHQWQSQLPSALGIESGTSSPPNASRTATDIDLLEAERRTYVVRRQTLVAVCTHTAAAFDMLADALVAGGFQAAWQLPTLPLQVRDAQVLLWDGWPDAQLHSSLPAPTVMSQVLLLDFPRNEDRQRALSLGAVEIVSRPFQLPQLWSVIAGAATSQATRQAEAAVA